MRVRAGSIVTKGGALSAALAVSFALLEVPVSAQAVPTFTINPTQGPVGTVITFTITGCPPVAGGPDGQVVLLYDFNESAAVNPKAVFEGSPATGTLTVTEPPVIPGRTVGPQVDVLPDCLGGGESQAAIPTFTITDATATTTTTTTPTTTTTTTTAPGGTGSLAAPAKPVRGTPSFTG